MNRLYILFLLLLCKVFGVNGQGLAFKWKEAIGDWHVGINLSTTRYCGDLSEQYGFDHLQLSWAAEGHLRYRFSEKFCVRSDVGFYSLRGDQQYTKNKANYLRFTTVNPSLIAGLQWNVRSIDYNQHNIPHFWLGVGATYLNPKTDYKGVSYSLPLFQTEKVAYSRIAGQVVIGGGMPFTLNKKSQLRLEARYTYILSDYVDDVSGTYADKTGRAAIEQILADRRREYGLVPNTVGEQRGNPLRNDGYFALTLQYSVKRSTP
ncbi:hypothetical protein ACAW74_13115 [Fibrella sp. WM1]